MEITRRRLKQDRAASQEHNVFHGRSETSEILCYRTRFPKTQSIAKALVHSTFVSRWESTYVSLNSTVLQERPEQLETDVGANGPLEFDIGDAGTSQFDEDDAGPLQPDTDNTGPLGRGC